MNQLGVKTNDFERLKYHRSYSLIVSDKYELIQNVNQLGILYIARKPLCYYYILNNTNTIVMLASKNNILKYNDITINHLIELYFPLRPFFYSKWNQNGRHYE